MPRACLSQAHPLCGGLQKKISGGEGAFGPAHVMADGGVRDTDVTATGSVMYTICVFYTYSIVIFTS